MTLLTILPDIFSDDFSSWVRKRLSTVQRLPRPNPKKIMVHGTYAGVYNLTLGPLQSRHQHIYRGQPGQPLCQSRLYPPVRDFGFGLCLYFYISFSQVNFLSSHSLRLIYFSFISLICRTSYDKIFLASCIL
jgi:hypothetical protein